MNNKPMTQEERIQRTHLIEHAKKDVMIILDELEKTTGERVSELCVDLVELTDMDSKDREFKRTIHLRLGNYEWTL